MEQFTTKDFSKQISKGKVIVDFWAEWCGPCKMIAPIFEELSGEIKDVKFGKLNVDENEDVAAKYGVRGIPTMVLYEDGEEVGRIVGFMPKTSLKGKIMSTFS